MKTRLFFPLVLVAACSGNPETTTAPLADVARTEQEVMITAGTPVTLADLSISGMTCERMCGGSIKDALAKLPGVAGTEIQFNAEAAENHAVVTYDPKQVSDAELVKAVQALHEGQYKVSAVKVMHQVLQAGDEVPAAAPAEEEGVNAALPELQVPSLFGLLARLIHL